MTADCVGGVWTYALELVSGLAAAGDEVFLAVMGGDLAPDQQRQLEQAPVAGWEARPLRLEWMPDPAEDLAAAGDWLVQLAEQYQPDIVHLNQFSFAVLPWRRPTLVVAHSDVVSWWRAVHGRDPDDAWASYRQRVAAGLSAADLVVAPTAAMLDDLRAAYPVSFRSAVVANGRRLPRRAHGKQPLIAAAGRMWDEATNVSVAVRACDGLPWQCAVAGPADDAETGAQFLGRLAGEETTDLLARASIFVAPAYYEPFGLAVLEAGLLGCALVVGDIPTLREVWSDAATFVAPDDEAALRREVVRLIDDPVLLRRRQDDAVRRAARFGPDEMVAAYRQCYAELAGVPAPAGRAAS